ncbi:MAG TPA: PAS domain-containing protein [Thermoanaerobaculia bacterium]|nr:PAS domain-containing protein [Thermoanaerobaculia bacterium]
MRDEIPGGAEGVLQALPLGVLVVGPDLAIRQANRAACALVGLAESALLGLGWRDVFPDASHGDGFPLPPRGLPLPASPIRGLVGHRAAGGGELTWLEVEAMPVAGAAGAPGVDHVVCTLRDVTRNAGGAEGWEERLRVEEQLLQARSEWTATVDTVADMILLEDSRGRVLRCNQAAARFFGATYTGIVGRHLNELFFPGEIGEDTMAEVHPLFRTASAVVQFPGPGHQDQWYEITNYPLAVRIARGGAGWVHVLENVTARREAEILAQRLAAAIDQAVESIVILDTEGRVEYINPAFSVQTGIGAEILGRRLRSFPVGPVDRQVYREIARTLLRGQVWQGTYAARGGDGAVYQEEATISPVRDAAGTVLDYVAVCRDITERRRLESIAEAVNMMDSVGYIFSNLRHELGNPVNSIKTALSVLRKNLDQYPRETVESYLDRTLAEVGRVEYLLKALRSFNMHEKPRVERLDMGTFLADFHALVREDFAGKGIAVEADVPAESWEALADPRALHQVLLNLLTNAADAVVGRETPRIVLRLERRPRSVDLAVVDNGAGIPDSQRAELFRPFHTGKPHGTGLGLVIVKKLVTQMGGTVEVTSEVGVGTEVRVSLRAALEAVEG